MFDKRAKQKPQVTLFQLLAVFYRTRRKQIIVHNPRFRGNKKIYGGV